MVCTADPNTFPVRSNYLKIGGLVPSQLAVQSVVQRVSLKTQQLPIGE